MTDAELWDYLQERFGFGDWDEALSGIPWWKFRGTEIGKLKRMMRRRRVTAVELTVAADYAIEYRKPVTALWQLFELIPEARGWRRKQQSAERERAVAREISNVVAEAMEAGESEWVDRLMRTQISEAQTVINEWRNR